MIKLSQVFEKIDHYVQNNEDMKEMVDQIEVLVYDCLGGEGIIQNEERYDKLRECYNSPQFINYKKAVDKCLDFVEKTYKGEKIFFNFSKKVPTEEVVKNARLALAAVPNKKKATANDAKAKYNEEEVF